VRTSDLPPRRPRPRPRPRPRSPPRSPRDPNPPRAGAGASAILYVGGMDYCGCCQRLSRRTAGGADVRRVLFLRLVLLVAKLQLRSSILQAAHLRVRAKRGESTLVFAVQVGPSWTLS
jgi:hypothetical protein